MLGILLLIEHAKETFVFTEPATAPADFARTVVENMTGYNHMSGGTFDHSPLSVSFYTHRMSVMLIGPVSQELFDQVRKRLQFEISRRAFQGSD
jgi:hypothetical protein